jgi:hypothetical protein
MGYEIKNEKDLAKAIASLEKKTQTQKNIIANSFYYLEENLKPINLIKKHKEIIVIGIVGIASGYLIRRLLFKKSTGLVAKIFGTAIQWGLAGIVSQNANRVGVNAGPVARRVFKKTKPSTSIIHVEAR